MPRLSWLLLGLALPMMACATDVGGGSPGAGGSQAGSGQTGAGGTTGAAGTTGTAGVLGTAGVTGTAGASGTGGSTTSTAGTTGTAGSAGGGATGAGGTAGSGGTSAGTAGTGTAGAIGTGGRGGTTGGGGATGSAGRGGSTGAAGSGATGSAGTSGTGTAGSTGAAGAGGGPVNLNGRKALLVVDNPGSLDNGEIILQMTLQNRGMVVTIGASTGPASIASGQDVLLVSSSAGSGDFVPVFKDVAVPMMVFGNSAYSNLGWIASSSGKGTVNSTTLCSLVDANTPLVSDVMTGVGFKMILDSRSTSLYWGTPGGSPIRAASIMGQATQLVSFAYEKGATMATGTAAARRVGFGVKVDSIQSLTIEGFKLLMAAIEWTAGP